LCVRIVVFFRSLFSFFLEYYGRIYKSGGTLISVKRFTKMDWINHIKQKIDKNKQTAGQNNLKKVTEATITKTTLHGKQKLQTTENQNYIINTTGYPTGTKLKIEIEQPGKEETDIKILESNETQVTKKEMITEIAKLLTELNEDDKEPEEYINYSGKNNTPQTLNKEAYKQLWKQHTILLHTLVEILRESLSKEEGDVSDQYIQKILKALVANPYKQENGTVAGGLDV